MAFSVVMERWLRRIVILVSFSLTMISLLRANQVFSSSHDGWSSKSFDLLEAAMNLQSLMVGSTSMTAATVILTENGSSRSTSTKPVNNSTTSVTQQPKEEQSQQYPPVTSQGPPPRNVSSALEGWIYEPKNLNYFWKKMGDRPFMREFYPKLSQFQHVLDIGARGYNRLCKDFINSSTTLYMQVEPHPPMNLSVDMNNDGLLQCTVQEIRHYYPQYQNFFDIVLDFGVFGWGAVQKGFTEQDIQLYVANIYHVLRNQQQEHENVTDTTNNSPTTGIWALKVDHGWTLNEQEFLAQYVEPYFQQGDFDVYKSGHTVKKNFRFLFFHKKDGKDIEVMNTIDQAALMTMTSNSTVVTPSSVRTARALVAPQEEEDGTKPITLTSSLLSTQSSTKDYYNAIELENRKPGTSNWVLTNPAMNREIEGYMSKTSVQQGDSIALFYNTIAPNVSMEVFRTGWYSGLGARQYLGGPILLPGKQQKIPRPGPLQIIQCDWVDPWIIQTQKDWTTGVYLVKMTESINRTQSYAIFVVREDYAQRYSLNSNNPASLSSPDILFQLPVNTYQAYNYWGGISLYGWGSGGPDSLPWGYHTSKYQTGAKKVSFLRPYARSNNDLAAYGNGAGEYITNVQPIHYYPINSSAAWNYNMVRWLERNHLDVSYITNVDTHVRLSQQQGKQPLQEGTSIIPKPKLFLTQGHDEYWSWEMRDNVEGLRDAGVHLAFLGSNTAFWQIRYEDVHETTGDPTTIVCYRRGRRDPFKNHLASTKFRSTRHEALMVGVAYLPGGDPFDTDLIVAPYASTHWVFKDSGVSDGLYLTGLLGYEVDGIEGMKAFEISGSTVSVKALFETPVINRLNKTLICHGSIYTAPSGAHVFSTGTMQWSWGLDDYNVEQQIRTSRLNKVADIVTRNILRAAGISISNGADDMRRASLSEQR